MHSIRIISMKCTWSRVQHHSMGVHHCTMACIIEYTSLYIHTLVHSLFTVHIHTHCTYIHITVHKLVYTPLYISLSTHRHTCWHQWQFNQQSPPLSLMTTSKLPLRMSFLCSQIFPLEQPSFSFLVQLFLPLWHQWQRVLLPWQG